MPDVWTAFQVAAPCCDGALSEAERRSLAGFEPATRAGMVAARLAARALFARVGLGGVDLPRVEGRAPEWPAGWHGSLAHCSRTGAAAIAPAALRGVGIDIEAATDIDDATLAVFATEAEQEACGDDRERRLVLFCAKEAAYKAFRCREERWLDPQEIAVADDFASARVGRAPPILLARIATIEGHVVIAARWP